MTTPRARLDAELVRRGLARSREQAGELIAAGRVAVAGQRAAKSATQVARDAPITVQDSGDPGYVSRGGHKLAGALRAFSGLVVAGRQCLDAGASTGGFTDVLLRAGAAHVVAADVGYGQLAWSLRTDPRVTVMDRVNVRTIGQVVPEPDLVVADLSFISLTLVLPALVACARPDADFVLLVKPQFEVGRDRVGAGGVVRDSTDRSAAVEKVSGAAAQTRPRRPGDYGQPAAGARGERGIFRVVAPRRAPTRPPTATAGIAASGIRATGGPGGNRGDGQSPPYGGRGGLGGEVSPQEQGGLGGSFPRG